ncbi:MULTISPECIES: pilus assembly protein PilP [Neisseria]|uniref:Pilin assembly protein n=1 Tax=Neisseria dumasiana TaxID=1931275 RepID=A0A1X3DKS8_9NEIS|nr:MULTISPECIES: pilus assembly protein PilP [Neisseria]KPN73897.1 pilin assembly protein [Neisseria sp. 74A18]OSI24986.1 pilin assembly protein [Neisseria dumasiana]OSI36311.1 pilin assembly protein [Neisseria dumasiana]UOO84188.1 pilus assembly protein PilP [Neisseria dumasiana]
MKKTLLLAGILAVSACTSSHDDLTKWMRDTRQQAKSKIIPFEAPAAIQAKNYTAPNFSGLHAFDSKRLVAMQQGANAPNNNRAKEVLESYSLENLKYVGSLTKGKQTSGYVEANGHVYTVLPGNYIGQNHGRIQSITADKILITELVEDSYGNWAYRKAELPLSGSDNGSDAAQNNN